MDSRVKALLLIIVVWAALSFDFVFPLTETQHMLVHLLVGSALTAWVLLRYFGSRKKKSL